MKADLIGLTEGRDLHHPIMARTGIETISAVYELERYKWALIPTGKNEVKCRCPVHGSDKDPSVSLNLEKNQWYCHTCKNKGDIVSLIAHITKTTRAVIIQDLSSRYDLEDEKEFPAETVEKFHQFFLKTLEVGNPLFTELQKRGVTKDLVIAARLGYYEGRITIPVYDAAGRIVNVRRYLPGAAKAKMQNTVGFGKIRLYQISELESNPNIIICGGELKALVAKHLLNKHKVGAVSATAGEGSWDSSWNMYFKGKKVWICMDIDPAGQSAARRIAELIYGSVAEVRIMQLPLNKDKYPKGDLSDYVGQEKATDLDLLKLMEIAKVYEPITVSVEIDKGTKDVTLAAIADPANVDYKLQFSGIVSAIDTTPYLVPKEVWATCQRDQPHCHLCPIKREDPDSTDGFVKKVISPTAKGILQMVNVPTKEQSTGIKASLGIPSCRTVLFEVKDHYSVVDVRLSPQLEISNDSSGIQQPAYVINSNIDLNLPYVFTGKVYPHPKNQQAILLISDFAETADSLAKYSLTQKDKELLHVFSCDPTVEAIRAKLDSIYSDLEHNVTHILCRRDLHLLVDLTYHSVLHIQLDGRKVNGWVNSLVCGDSAQGKSETTTRLKQHYALGERIECKNASVAGLVGGLQQLGLRWFVTWGIIPTNDRRLVFLEEIKGASTEIIGKLTDMRSSGIAEIPKIERRRAHARTRLCFISNPRESQPVSAFNFGIEALQNLVGSLEDIRRFDIACLLASEDVDLHKLVLRTDIPHIHTSELCHKLVLFAWTVKPENVVFATGTEAAAKDAAVAMNAKYTEAFPLVDKGTIKQKILRLATALAARLYSVNEEKLIVHPAHVQYIAEWMDSIYSNPRFGYVEFTKSQQSLHIIPQIQIVERFINETRHPESLTSGLLVSAEINQFDIMDWCEVDRDAAQNFMSFLVRNHCVRRQKYGYVKTPAFITLLKNMRPKKDAPVPDF